MLRRPFLPGVYRKNFTVSFALPRNNTRGAAPHCCSIAKSRAETFDTIPIDFHSGLKTYAVQQYFYSVGCACLSLKNSCEPFERTSLNHHIGARFETGADFYKTCRVNLVGNDFNHPVVNRRRVITYTHDAMHPSSETNLMK